MKQTLLMSKRGNIALIALIFMAIILAMAPILYNNSIHSYTLHREQMRQMQALSLAATGIISAEKIVLQEELWRGTNFVQQFGEQSARVQLVASGNNKGIQWFSATVNFPDYKIQLVRSKSYLIGGREHEIYQYDIYARNNLTIATGVTAEHIRIASRGIAENRSPLVLVQENIDIILPVFNRVDYTRYSTYLPLWNQLEQGFDGRVMGKMYEPNFTLGEYATLLGSGIIINSNISLKKNSNVIGNWHLISENNITISDNSKLNNVLLFAKGDVIINNNVDFSGIIIAGGNVKIGNNCNIRVATEELSIIASSIYSS